MRTAWLNLTILVGVILLIWWFVAPKPEHELEFVDPSAARAVADRSPYFSWMNATDLAVRGGWPDAAAYRRWYGDQFRHPTPAERELLARAVGDAHRCLGCSRWFCSLGPWRIAMTSAAVERGYPHTLGNMIVASTDMLSEPYNVLVELLVHERTHIFQRAFPATCQRLYEQWGFRVAGPRMNGAVDTRTNPDSDGRLWVYRTNQAPAEQVFRPGATSIADVDEDFVYPGRYAPGARMPWAPAYMIVTDHPNEIMAYEVARVAVRGEPPMPELPGVVELLQNQTL